MVLQGFTGFISSSGCSVAMGAPIEALLPVFDRGHVAIVMDGERFVGLITRIDLLNFLRRRVQ